LSDPEFWPEEPPEDSTFIHRLAVRRQYAGTGVSSALIDWAVERTRSLGRHYLRLDCDALRPRLREFYERHGFVFHSEIEVGPYRVTRYEHRVDL
jgi:GNAT superfamily N-acetyltransferase